MNDQKKNEKPETETQEQIESLDELLEVLEADALRNVTGGLLAARPREDVG